MTRTASKASGRAAHAARTKKHAQRTPLPAKGAKAQPRDSVRIAKEVAAKRTSKRPAKDGTSLALNAASKQRAEAVRAAEKRAAVERELAAKKAAPRKKSTASKARAAVAQGGAGTKTFGADTAGLATQVKEMRDSGDLWRAISERLGLGEGKTGTARARRLYKVANGGSKAPRKAPTPRQPTAARRARQAPTPEALQALPRLVPWNGSPTAEDVLALVRGRSLQWINRLSGLVEEGTVPVYERTEDKVKQPNGQVRIVVTERGKATRVEANAKGELVLHFVSTVGGFRSCRVADITKVG